MTTLESLEGKGIDLLDPRWQSVLNVEEEPYLLNMYQLTLGGIILTVATEDIDLVEGNLSFRENPHIHLMGALDPNASPLASHVLYHFDNAGEITGWDRGTVASTGDYVQRAAIDERLAVGFELLARSSSDLTQSVRRNLATLRQPGSQYKHIEGSSLNHRL